MEALGSNSVPVPTVHVQWTLPHAVVTGHNAGLQVATLCIGEEGSWWEAYVMATYSRKRIFQIG